MCFISKWVLFSEPPSYLKKISNLHHILVIWLTIEARGEQQQPFYETPTDTYKNKSNFKVCYSMSRIDQYLCGTLHHDYEIRPRLSAQASCPCDCGGEGHQLFSPTLYIKYFQIIKQQYNKSKSKLKNVIQNAIYVILFKNQELTCEVLVVDTLQTP